MAGDDNINNNRFKTTAANDVSLKTSLILLAGMMLPFEALHGRQMMPLIAFHSSLSYGHCDTLDFAVLAVPQIVRVPCLWPH